MARIPISRPLYQYLITESRGLCNLCHRTTIDQIHHIVPVEFGGTNAYGNLIPLCASCHAKIHKSNPLPQRLKAAKQKWILECNGTIAAMVSSAASEFERVNRVISAYDAVTNVIEFEGFQLRLTELLKRHSIFENLFRVLSHRIEINVDREGNAKVTEVQRWSAFVPTNKRAYHIEGPSPCPTADVAFTAKAKTNNRWLDITVDTIKDHPTYKSYSIVFQKSINPRQTVEVSLDYYWPRAWNIQSDRYTYDILGWAESVEYRMCFPPDVKVTSVSDSYIDVFGSEWPSIGRAQVQNRNSFQWKAKRLPLFSTAIITYTTEGVQHIG